MLPVTCLGLTTARSTKLVEAQTAAAAEEAQRQPPRDFSAAASLYQERVRSCSGLQGRPSRQSPGGGDGRLIATSRLHPVSEATPHPEMRCHSIRKFISCRFPMPPTKAARGGGGLIANGRSHPASEPRPRRPPSSHAEDGDVEEPDTPRSVRTRGVSRADGESSLRTQCCQASRHTEFGCWMDGAVEGTAPKGAGAVFEFVMVSEQCLPVF